ncbi:similar to Saccharomyces cerevisiae YDR084C TVP23 Integral membrane protein localized to late Golgi vesicles along with the v-SNARE Tlg2p [Maudiozyma barnettii]|uniref:Golgi apparatus membrane protein TVP23 n=1 Tax=Maudiozyma barnettii TaxID=61262 RepID=A0A8H2VHT6_9SACH|nr:Tvp23p [Kazachstania barnettii]CAB4255732.1 similar to Saccharomyces cerevisiae YDR084C TVP23 Integral membrane protein localized to late Golgi vesicles along with the v-SNARE Tlg2p [Kazachstania barnettii]CAD1784293.1 similar to Saccharomyces cerevisiae YDR084C TVP23 Integral membrane protein localized to late Golgi vesicles along with the v-SNARE Tlg2p [Kazachstania barnettii]
MEHIKGFYNTILKSSHPITLSLHLAGKAFPLVFYLLGDWFTGFTAQFIVIILVLAFDFYFTKNISGRKLVQLRWWYDSTVTRTTTFVFESYKQYPADGHVINPIDSKLFWWSMYLTPVVWLVFGLLCLLRLKLFYLLVVAVAVCLTGWNTYGFRCCDKWEPGHDVEDGAETWFQLPNFGGFENISRLANVQSFFQRATGSSSV